MYRCPSSPQSSFLVMALNEHNISQKFSMARTPCRAKFCLTPRNFHQAPKWSQVRLHTCRGKEDVYNKWQEKVRHFSSTLFTSQRQGLSVLIPQISGLNFGLGVYLISQLYIKKDFPVGSMPTLPMLTCTSNMILALKGCNLSCQLHSDLIVANVLWMAVEKLEIRSLTTV